MDGLDDENSNDDERAELESQGDEAERHNRRVGTDDDDDDVNERNVRTVAAVVSDDDDDDERDDDDDDDDERKRGPAPPKPVVTTDDIFPVRPQLGSKLRLVKLPNFLSINTNQYDDQSYEGEVEDEIVDNEGRARMKLKIENTIRWRVVRDEDGNEVRQSNARIVEWSDGTMSLYLGSEIFELNEKSIGEVSHLFISTNCLQGQAILDKKLSIRPNSTESFTHKKLTLSIADRSQKKQKIRMLHNPGTDPEARLNELSKREDDKLKATLRRETKQRRILERSQTRGPSSSYLEPDYEEDEDGAISLSAIKRGALKRGYVDSGSSEEDEDQDSDDSDPEFGKVQKRPERKSRQVVEDSDEET